MVLFIPITIYTIKTYRVLEMIQMSSLDKLVIEKSNAHVWDIGLHDQVDNKPESSTKLWDVSLKNQVK